MGEFGVGSRGAGGGTISTAALYYEMYNVLDENITFVEVCEALFASRLPGRIHAMTDVTNGGGANSSGALVLTGTFSDIRSVEWKRRGLG